MMVVKFWGGLGNQMFEYAFMLRLKKTYPDVRIMGYIPSIQVHNGFELDRVFNLSIDRCSKRKAIFISGMDPGDYISNTMDKFWHRLFMIKNFSKGKRESYINPDDFTAYYEEVFHLSRLKDYFFDGVWANSNYLSPIKDELDDVFSFDNNFNESNQRIAERIKNTNSVSIHVRRGDYVTDNQGALTDRYYHNAVSVAAERLQSPCFFVFSDDGEYCKKLFEPLKIDYTVVQGNIGENSFRDMQLMSLCRHNIIANSTFSFWGAFLNKNSNKLVIGPKVGIGESIHPYRCEKWEIIDTK
jgi:hypothetical protein